MQAAILKWIIEWAASWLIDRIGHTNTAKHMQSVLIKYTPPTPDPLPSPSELRKPKQPWLDAGGSISDAS